MKRIILLFYILYSIFLATPSIAVGDTPEVVRQMVQKYSWASLERKEQVLSEIHANTIDNPSFIDNLFYLAEEKNGTLRSITMEVMYQLSFHYKYLPFLPSFIDRWRNLSRARGISDQMKLQIHTLLLAMGAFVEGDISSFSSINFSHVKVDLDNMENLASVFKVADNKQKLKIQGLMRKANSCSLYAVIIASGNFIIDDVKKFFNLCRNIGSIQNRTELQAAVNSMIDEYNKNNVGIAKIIYKFLEKEKPSASLDNANIINFLGVSADEYFQKPANIDRESSSDFYWAKRIASGKKYPVDPGWPRVKTIYFEPVAENPFPSRSGAKVIDFASAAQVIRCRREYSNIPGGKKPD